ncbi:MAG TPA: S53 family peptidase [Dyella sp.]|uniref:S53 family peptidase n=1 Tax=Dyella sp. TaxID=1869338 RepID=UPI002BD06757|nr:S53 family peptidase [Dyella sp.]HUB89736.1 S53 family peptidase [Dyella sp.]
MTRQDSIGTRRTKGLFSARKTCALALAIAMAFGASAAANAGQVYTHHVRDVVSSNTAQLVGSLPASKLMSLDVVLPVRDQAGLDNFLAQVSNPMSLNYHNYLTPTEFTARFGPTQNDYDTVVQYLKQHGLVVAGGSRDRMDIQVIGPVSAVESAFNVKMRTYRHPTENRIFYSPDREPTTSLAIPLWHVSGLDNYSLPHPLFVKKSDYAAAHGISPDAVVSHATTGSGPSASFLGSDMRAAYYHGGTLTGTGESVGLWEFYGINTSDVALYYSTAKQTNPNNLRVLSTDGSSTGCSGSCSDIEQTLDVTQAQGMAPGLSNVLMYVGSTDTAIISAMTVTTDGYAPPATIGCSWGWTPADPSTLNPYWEKMAAQGQSFFAASGDSSTWSSRNEAWPADAAYVIGVGGTDLTTSGAAGPWATETAWVDSGGGISPDKIAIPSWQTPAINSSNKGSTKYRNGPDVSANANFTFMACGNGSCTYNEYGGTSFAAPMWAGFVALVDQSLASHSASNLGFFLPTIYSNNINSSSIYAATFHDITSGKSGSYSAVKGYDLVTGWGSPVGSGFMSQYGQ